MKKVVFALSILAAGLSAAPVTYRFTGTTTSTMTVNNGTSYGGIGAGTPYSGALIFDDAQTAAPVAFSGGTRSTFRFDSMSLTVGATTLTWGPGTIDLYDNLATTANGYPVGDSFYANLTAPVAPGGTINGAQFNWIFLGFVDGTGTAFSGPGLPATLNFASFQSAFIEFNYGTLGTPFGAGNTSTLQFLSTLSKTSANPAPPPTVTTTSLVNGVIGVPYSAAVAASAPNGDGVTLAVSGLPAGLSFNGTAIAGTPGAVGTSQVSITATDTVTGLSTTSTLPLTINDAAITFTASLPNGVVNYPYSATFAPATGGTGVFTYTASGLPAGLALSGTTVAGTPTASGSFPVTLTATDSAGYSAFAAATLTIGSPAPAPCSGKNAVESAYVARTPGFIVVNGGLNLLDHLWTTNLNPSNTTFLGGLVNWYQTGLILDYSGTVDPNGCILSSLTVRPAVTIDTASLAGGTVGMPYAAPLSVSWGVPPYSITAAGLPAGLSLSNSQIVGTPSAAGSFTVAVTAVDAVGATAVRALALTISPSAYTVADEGQGKITAVGATYLMIGKKTLVWTSNTRVVVNTPDGERHVIDSFVQPGMKAQWKGMRDKNTNTVLTSDLEIN